MQTKNETNGTSGTGGTTTATATAATTTSCTSESNNVMMDGSIKPTTSSSSSIQPQQQQQQQQQQNIPQNPTSSTSRPSSAATTNTSSSNNNNNNNIQSSPTQSPHTMIRHSIPHHPNSPLPPAPPLSPPKQQRQSSYDQSSLHSYDSHPSSIPSQQQIHQTQKTPPHYNNRAKTITTSNVSPTATSTSTSNNYNGVIQGMEMLEKQQMKWEEQERRRRIMESQSADGARQISNANKKLNEEQQLNWKHSAAGGGGSGGYLYYNSNTGLPLPLFPKGLAQDQYNTNSVGGSGVGGGGQYHNYQLSRGGSGNSSNRGVPQTVHVNGDYDDVSESLMDEGGGNGSGGNINSEINGKKKDEMKRVNSIGKFLKTPLVRIIFVIYNNTNVMTFVVVVSRFSFF
jgi:hypothetical protein